MSLIAPILAADSSAGVTSVSLWDGISIHTLTETEPNRQAEMLVPMLQKLLQQRGFAPQDLAGYAVTLGPGSFTGIRIALSAFIGMQTVHHRPIYGVNTLEVAAFLGNLKEGGAIVREALRGQAYVQLFKPGFVPESECMLLPYEAIPATTEGRTTLSNCSAVAGLPLPTVTADGILGLLRVRNTVTPLALDAQKPLYIRPPDAKLPTLKAL